MNASCTLAPRPVALRTVAEVLVVSSQNARLRLSALVVPLVLLALACGTQSAAPSTGASPVAQSQNAPTVSITDNAFAPQSLTVKAGSTVTWNWTNTRNPHSVVGKYAGQDIDSGRHSGSDRFTFTFASPGTFDYQCGVHGASMSGKIIVE